MPNSSASFIATSSDSPAASVAAKKRATNRPATNLNRGFGVSLMRGFHDGLALSDHAVAIRSSVRQQIERENPACSGNGGGNGFAGPHSPDRGFAFFRGNDEREDLLVRKRRACPRSRRCCRPSECARDARTRRCPALTQRSGQLQGFRQLLAPIPRSVAVRERWRVLSPRATGRSRLARPRAAFWGATGGEEIGDIG